MEQAISVFMSYAHEDKLLVRRVAQGLTSYGVKVWIDEGELLVGDSIIERISSAIEDVHFVVAIVSKHSVESSWCKKELALAMTGGLKKKGVKVLPLRVGDTIMPPALRDLMYLQLDKDNVDDVVSRLVLAAMRHNTEHRVAEALVPASAPKGISEFPSTRLDEDNVDDVVSRLEGTSGFPPTQLEGASTSSLKPTWGSVKWWNAEKGYGFITQDGGGPDVFAHYSEIQTTGYRTLEDNQRVEFEVAPGPKGPMAAKIRPV